MYTVLHMFTQLLYWAGDQNNHQNFDPSFLLQTLTDFYVNEAKKKSKMADTKKLSFSIPPILKKKIQKFHGHKLNLEFFCFIPMKSVKVS